MILDLVGHFHGVKAELLTILDQEAVFRFNAEDTFFHFSASLKKIYLASKPITIEQQLSAQRSLLVGPTPSGV
jgi:hypothetical protein